MDLYDLLDSPDRPDLDMYIKILEEYKVQTVIDLGCGTGSFACKLAAVEKDVFAIDPASASLNVVKRKNSANKVSWYHGTIAILPDLQVVLITMTGNVAQVFLTDEDWISTLKGCHDHLKPGGRLIFEVRDPGKQAWNKWQRKNTNKVINSPVGKIETWVDLLEVQLYFVKFRHTFVFHHDDIVLTSTSTLRYRSKTEIINSLLATNLVVEDIRDAPDRSWVRIYLYRPQAYTMSKHTERGPNALYLLCHLVRKE